MFLGYLLKVLKFCCQGGCLICRVLWEALGCQSRWTWSYPMACPSTGVTSGAQTKQSSLLISALACWVLPLFRIAGGCCKSTEKRKHFFPIQRRIMLSSEITEPLHVGCYHYVIKRRCISRSRKKVFIYSNPLLALWGGYISRWFILKQRTIMLLLKTTTFTIVSM